jgi:hypothetical protein
MPTAAATARAAESLSAKKILYVALGNELLAQGFTAHGYVQVRASYGSVLLPLWEQDGLRMGGLAERASSASRR